MSDNKEITNESSKNVALHDNGVRAGTLIEQSVRNLSKDQLQALGTQAGEELIKLEIKQREQQLDYITGKKVAEDHVDTWNMLNKEGKTTGVKMVSEIKTGAGNMKIENRSGATCFVATATYQREDHPNVEFLRTYRDTVLASSSTGRKFIAWYWQYGPSLAKYVTNSSLLRSFSKISISAVVFIVRLFYSRKS
jgi:hypothetical protein